MGDIGEQRVFQGWAIFELMGHNREIGFTEMVYFGGPGLFRVDQPELPARQHTIETPEWIDGRHCPAGTVVERQALPGKTTFVGPSSVFRMTPCTEETAKKAIELMISRPVKILSIPESRELAAVRVERYDEREHDDDDDEEAF